MGSRLVFLPSAHQVTALLCVCVCVCVEGGKAIVWRNAGQVLECLIDRDWCVIVCPVENKIWEGGEGGGACSSFSVDCLLALIRLGWLRKRGKGKDADFGMGRMRSPIGTEAMLQCSTKPTCNGQVSLVQPYYLIFFHPEFYINRVVTPTSHLWHWSLTISICLMYKYSLQTSV
jgi:hypothetical protein